MRVLPVIVALPSPPGVLVVVTVSVADAVLPSVGDKPETVILSATLETEPEVVVAVQVIEPDSDSLLALVFASAKLVISTMKPSLVGIGVEKTGVAKGIEKAMAA